MTVLDKSYFLATGITLSVCSKDHSHPPIPPWMKRLSNPVWPKRIHTPIGGPAADLSEFRNSGVMQVWGHVGLPNLKMGAVLISIFFCMFHQHKWILPFKESHIFTFREIYFKIRSKRFESDLFCIEFIVSSFLL